MRVVQILFFVVFLSVLGCKTGHQTVSTPQVTEGKQVGVDKDEHGCNKAAGYTWSELRKDCIRLFESGIRLNSATDPNATLSAFIVFSADSTKVEVFIPDDQKHPILEKKQLSDGTSVWESKTDLKQVRSVNAHWVIEQQGKTLYIQPNK